MAPNVTNTPPVARELLRALGQSCLGHAIEHAAGILIGSGDSCDLVTDLPGIAKRFGVRRIRFEAIPCDGVLIPSGDDYEMVISESAPPNRQRFSIAHELAHALIHRLIPDTRRLATRSVFMPPGDVAEERLCDAIAGALLMPRDRVLSRFMNRPVNVPLLREIAASFRVSIASATVRVGELVGKKFGLWQFAARPHDGEAVFNDCVIRGEARLRPNKDQVFGAPSILAHAAVLGREYRGWEWIPRGLTKSRLFLVTEPSEFASCSRTMLVITSTQDISAVSLQMN